MIRLIDSVIHISGGSQMLIGITPSLKSGLTRFTICSLTLSLEHPEWHREGGSCPHLISMEI